MYLYFYAPFLRARRYEREVGLIEGRVTDFGLSGKVVQLSQFLKLPAAIREYGRRVSTLVLVGGDDLLEEAAANLQGSGVVLAFIPMAESPLAATLAIPQGPKAVETLAARRIARLDLGSIAGHFFVGTARTVGPKLEIHCPSFSLYPKGLAELTITNLGEEADPEDGKLNVRLTPIEGRLFRKKPGNPTIFTTPSLRIKAAKPLPISFGSQQRLKLPIQIDSAPKAVRMIVGRKVKKRM